MAWVRIDDKFPQHPKIASAGPLAIAMQVAGLCYCNRELTDGFIPRSIARTLLDWQFEREDGRLFTIAITCGMVGDDLSSQWVIDLLCEVGMWEEVPGGYQIHDYTDYQPTKQQILEERERKIAAGKAGGQASAKARAQAGASPQGKQKVKQNPTPKPNPVPNEGSNEPSGPQAATEDGDDPKDDDGAKPEPPTPEKRKSRIPADFALDESLYEYGAKLDLSRDAIDAETEKFRLHHLAKGTLHVDWRAAWQYWMRKSIEYQRRQSPFPSASQVDNSDGLGFYRAKLERLRRREFIGMEATTFNGYDGARKLAEAIANCEEKLGLKVGAA
jgi:hypothetical protein